MYLGPDMSKISNNNVQNSSMTYRDEVRTGCRPVELPDPLLEAREGEEWKETHGYDNWVDRRNVVETKTPQPGAVPLQQNAAGWQETGQGKPLDI